MGFPQLCGHTEQIFFCPTSYFYSVIDIPGHGAEPSLLGLLEPRALDTGKGTQSDEGGLVEADAEAER